MIGDAEYKKAVDEELVRCDESLRALHHGDVRYLALLEKMDPGQSKTLAAIPHQIQAVIGIAPLPLFYAMTNFLIASHRLSFEMWAAQELVGLELLMRRIKDSGKAN
jgi:hypothetical protein